MENLEHSGIKGQKWYQRRFQNEDGSLTAEGRLRYGVGEARRSSSKTKVSGSSVKQKVTNAKEAKKVLAQKKQAEEEKAKQKAAKEAEEKRKKEKDSAINSGKASTVAKYRDLMTTSELKTALDRIDTETRLDTALAKEADRTRSKSFIEKFKEKGQKVSDVLGTISNVGNKVNNVMQTIQNIQDTMDKKNEKNEDAEDKAMRAKMEKIIRSGNAEKIYKNFPNMNAKEVENATKRLASMATIQDKYLKKKK